MAAGNGENFSQRAAANEAPQALGTCSVFVVIKQISANRASFYAASCANEGSGRLQIQSLLKLGHRYVRRLPVALLIASAARSGSLYPSAVRWL
jgi:hypothetical protein